MMGVQKCQGLVTFRRKYLLSSEPNGAVGRTVMVSRSIPSGTASITVQLGVWNLSYPLKAICGGFAGMGANCHRCIQLNGRCSGNLAPKRRVWLLLDESYA